MLISEMHNGLSINVNGFSIGLTPLDQFTIPPPLSLALVDQKSYVETFCMFKNKFFVILQQGLLRAYQYDFPKKLTYIAETLLQENASLFFCRHMSVTNGKGNDFELGLLATSCDSSDVKNVFLYYQLAL